MTSTPPRPPNIRDVAKLAGVSVATASRVMAKADYPVAMATQQKVIDAAHALGFVPNFLARGLSGARTDSIGVVAPGIANPYYATMVEGINRAARQGGLTMLLGLTGGDEVRREEIMAGLLARKIDGIILCAGADDHLPCRSPASLGIPAVLIGRQHNPGFPMIMVDNHGAGVEAARYLWSLGHRHFGYLTSEDSWHDFRERGQGMREFLNSTRETFELQILGGLLGEVDTYQRVRSLCQNGGSSITAFLASTDRHALGALAALADEGRNVPDRVSVMGFDDYVTSGFVRPSLTTMKMPSAEMGEAAVARLREMISGRGGSETTVLCASLVERASTSVATGLE